MTITLINALVKCLTDQLIALEFADEDNVNPDFAVGIMESIGAELGELSKQDIIALDQSLRHIAESATDEEQKNFVADLLDNLGIERPSTT